jgi:hypothetical protein
MSGILSSSKEQQENLPAIGNRYLHLREDQDKLSSSGPRLPKLERYIELRVVTRTIQLKKLHIWISHTV